ncbi:hypothetical protein ZIOFF_039332 [Zingiber officinale]|uniref:DDT domain-containing protein n=1 Tax=Zingiber officinale TaxID=94328 RepID=A0A8J5L036_ZINOF|nr:hypothetical protein ZIOFF_039332 [Zingiber officinale]
MAVPQNSPADGSLAAEERIQPDGASASSPARPFDRLVVPGLDDDADNPGKPKTCHQCRQKRTDFSAPCGQIRRGKPCPIKYCHKCLLNRYGEKPEDASLLESWICPKCRGDCNCSLCMKKKGHQPTGILIHRAKSTGFTSVHELLLKQGSDVLRSSNRLRSSKMDTSKKLSISPRRIVDQENCLDELRDPESSGSDDKNIKTSAQKEKKSISKKRRHADSAMYNSDGNVAFVIPQGQLLTEVAESAWADEDVGAALQFLEFCNAFSEVLDIKKGEPKSVLWELAKGSVGRRGQYSSTVKFHMKLLSFIQNGKGGDRSVSNSTMNEDKWLQLVIKCLNDSDGDRKAPLGVLDEVSLEYDSWIPSDKLRLLNLLCDKTLETKELRDWIDGENQRYIERKKEAKGTIVAANKKKKDLKKKLKDEMAKATLSLNGPISSEDHENLMSQIRAETEKAHAEKQEIMEQLPKILMIDLYICILIAYADMLYGQSLYTWKERDMFIGNWEAIMVAPTSYTKSWDSVMLEDKWYAYGEEEDKLVERDISFLRYETNSGPVDSIGIGHLQNRKRNVESSLRQKSVLLHSAGNNSSNDPSSSCSDMEGEEGACGSGNSETGQEAQQLDSGSGQEMQQLDSGTLAMAIFDSSGSGFSFEAPSTDCRYCTNCR